MRKRSVDRSEAHHNALNTEPEVSERCGYELVSRLPRYRAHANNPFIFVLFFFPLCLQVRWVQQQHEKPRFKRDYSTFDQDFVRFPGFRSLVSGTRMAYRDTSTHNIFPDPLFKEQWYLVSAVGVLSSLRFKPFCQCICVCVYLCVTFRQIFCWFLFSKAVSLAC